MDKLRRTAKLRKEVEHYATVGSGGVCWYYESKESIESFCYKKGWDSGVFTDLLSLFSPQVSVKRSVMFALTYMETGEFEHDVMRQIRAAVEHYATTGEIRGKKTRAFALALKGNGDALVLDVWMSKAFRIHKRRMYRKDNYKLIRGLLEDIAVDNSWTIAETQAAIWSGIIISRNGNPGSISAHLAELTPQLSYDTIGPQTDSTLRVPFMEAA